MIPEIVVRAVELDLWTPQQALDVANQTSEPIPRGKLFALLLETGNLDGEQSTRAIRSCLDAVKEMPAKYGDTAQGRVLGLLISHLPQELLKEALDLTLGIAWHYHRRPAMVVLVPRLDDKLWEAILSHIQSLPVYKPTHPYQVELIRQVAPDLPDHFIPQLWVIFQKALTATTRAAPVNYIADTLQALIPRLPADHLESAFETAMDLPQSSNYFNHQAESLAVLAPRLSGKLLDKVIEYGTTYQGKHGATKALILSAVLNQKPALLNEAVKATLQTDHSRLWLKALKRLSPHLQGKKLDRIFKAAMTLPVYMRIDGLMILLPRLNRMQKRKALDAAVETLPHIRAGDPDSIDEEYQVTALRKLAPFLDQPSIEKAVEFAMTVKSNREKCYMLVDLAAQIADKDRQAAVLKDALDGAFGNPATLVTHAIGDRSALVYLAPNLSGELLDQALHMLMMPLEQHEMMQEIAQFPEFVKRFKRSSQSENNRALAALAPKLSGEQVNALLQ